MRDNLKKTREIMEATLTKIGNSQGIRLSKKILKAAGIEKDVVLTAEAGKIIIENKRKPRQGWAEMLARETPDSFEEWDVCLSDGID